MEPRPPLPGLGDSPLTPLGIAQAEAIGRRLVSVPEAVAADLVASPIGRARRTAEIIAAGLGRTAPPRLDDRLREISLGSWDGRDRREIVAGAPQMFEGDGRWEWYFQTPDGETYDGFAGRIGSWLAEPRDGPLIVVAHGVVTRVLRGLYADLPRSHALRLAVPQDRIFHLSGGTIVEIAV